MQLNLFTGKHPSDNIIDRLEAKIKIPREPKKYEMISIKFLKYLKP